MEIYRIDVKNESDWVCAIDVLGALITYTQITELLLCEIDDIVNIPDSEWDNLTIINPDDGSVEQTFKEYMDTAVTSEIISTTAY